MNLQTLIAVSIIFNLSLNAISIAGIGPLTDAIPYQPPPQFATAIKNLNSAQTAAQAIAGAGQCTIPANATAFNYLSCNPVITGIQGILTTVLTFGIFLWGVVNILPFFAEAILLPGAFLTHFGVNQTIVDIFATAFILLYVLWGYVLITGRYNAEIQ